MGSISIIRAPCKLKKCPWGKIKPELFKEELWNGNHGYYGNYDFYVKCNNQKCKIRPQTIKYDDVYRDASIAIKSACDDWNNRGDNENKQTTKINNQLDKPGGNNV